MHILSDFSDVLAYGINSFPQNVEAELGLPADEFGVLFKKELPRLWQLCRGRVTEKEFWADVANDCLMAVQYRGRMLNGDELRMAFYHHMREKIPGTLDVYQRIMYYPMRAGKGGRVGDGIPEIDIVSDHVSEMIPMLHQWHPEVFLLAKREYWSCDFDQVKADPCFFKFLLNGLKCEPDECLLIDDSPRNVERAMLAGIPAIQFVNAEQLEAEMTKLGFVFFPKEECNASGF